MLALLLAIFLVIPLLGGLLVVTGGSDDSPSTTSPATFASLPQVSDLPAVQLDELPPEAIETLSLIAQDGPFPYDRDGLVFQNREGILPEQPEGYYREYTVPTPGEDDRGARRLVVGSSNEVFYTDDHYESFRELVLG